MIRTTYWHNKITKGLRKLRKKEEARLKRYRKYTKEFSQAEEDAFVIPKGFKELQWGVYLHEKGNVVIKFGNYYSNNVKYNYKTPTITSHKNGIRFTIQPLANMDIKSRNRAFDILNSLPIRNVDLHEYNTGMWKGLPVLIDW